MLRDVNRTLRLWIVLASSVLAALAASPALGGDSVRAAVHPTVAPSSSTRHVAHVAAHHKHHVRAHRTEPNLHAQPVARASQPAPVRVPAHPRVPRSSHGATAPNVTHRDGGTRTNWAAGLPTTGVNALSIAVLGTCVHQRTRDRLRSVSQPLESRGPPRAGPNESSACRIVRGAHDLPPSASALNLPHGRSPVHRASRTAQPFCPPRLSPWPVASPLATHTCPLEPPFHDARALSRGPASSANSPISAVQGPCAPSEAPERGRVLRRVEPSVRRNT